MGAWLRLGLYGRHELALGALGAEGQEVACAVAPIAPLLGERGVLDGVVRHDGDPVLREHLAWCAADRADSGELRRVSKADRTRPIDAVIAVALAYWRASLDAGGSVYDRRGMLTI